MADEAIELGFEAFDKVTDRYHDYMYDRARKMGQHVKQRKHSGRPGMERRSSSAPPGNELERLEEGRGGSQRQNGYGQDDRYGRRSRVYVDDHGQDYLVPASRQQPYDDDDSNRQAYGNDRGIPDDQVRRRRTNSETQHTRRQSRDDRSQRGRSPHSSSDKKSKVHHLAAAVAGGVAGGFVGQTAGKGDMKAMIAGALIGAAGAGFADQVLEKRQGKERREDKQWEDKFER